MLRSHIPPHHLNPSASYIPALLPRILHIPVRAGTALYKDSRFSFFEKSIRKTVSLYLPFYFPQSFSIFLWKLHKKETWYPSCFSLMPATGIEPVLYFYNRILSPARLPVPPRRQSSYKKNCIATYVQKLSLTSYLSMLSYRTIQWAEVDSNHRSNLQQIYSLSPLATRESAHSSGMSWQEFIIA